MMQEYQNNPKAFPKSNGHIAWSYASKTIEEAAIEDLFWRKIQVSPTFAWEVVSTVWPDAERGKWDAFIRPNLYVSLLPESCGAYTFGGWCGLRSLRGDALDTKRIEQGTQWPDRGGYYPRPLVAKHTGWLPQNVVPNLLQAKGQKLTVSDRFRFNLKANHRQVLMGKALTKDEFDAIVKMAYPVRYNSSSWNVYWYRTESGDINFGIIYFFDSKRNVVHRLPISAWVADSAISTSNIYDMLNIAPPYPLYDLDMLVRYDEAQYALICDSEATVEHIKRYFAWMLHWWPVTTYTDIERTDWNPLRGKTPIIFPEATEHGIRMALRLGDVLVKHGFSPRFLRRQRCSRRWSAEFVQDLGQLEHKDGECILPEFAEHSLREFGVQPPDGLLPKAVGVADLPEPAVPLEVLMDGLLNTGEQMTIHAWRGIGKSLFAMLLALCFASGKSALNGRVYPSRKYRVLLLDGEMSTQTLKRRARRLCNGHGLPIETTKELKIRSNRNEKKALELETDAGFKELEPDMKAAEIIVVDSVFKFFTSAMKPDFDATKMMQRFLDYARENEKTLIVIDHEGKGGATSYGSMGKEISSDVVLRLCRAKSPHVIEAHVQKVRDHAEPSGPYLRMRIEADKDEYITIQNCDASKVVAALGGESSDLNNGEAESTESSTERATSLDEAIKQSVREQPDAAQGVIVTALKERGYGGRSTIQGRIKVLSEGGQLPAWKNRPRSHKVAGQPASEGDQN